MRKLVLLLAGLAMVASLPATTGFSGLVFNAETREPIVGATVCCYVTNTRTDSAGSYLMADLAPGKYRVRAFATGFQTGYLPESVLVVHGQVTPDIDFALVPNGHPNGGISGRVRNAVNQAPIPGALVTAHGPNGSGSVQSQPCGGYIINGLPAGKYRVCAQATGFESGVYPESVLVTGGQVVPNIDFALVPTGGQNGCISGFVTGAQNGEPIFGALVTAIGPGHGSANTCQRGGYIIRELPPGLYVVQASATGFEPSPVESVAVVAGQTTPNVNFSLVPLGGGLGGISGIVRDSVTMNGIPGANVFAWGSAGQGHGVTDSVGHYLITGLRPGDYVVRACAQGYYPSTYPESVLVVENQTTPHICFHLTPVGDLDAGIGGFVFDGRTQAAISGALVTAIGIGGSYEASTDAQGDYLIAGLEPGDYLVRVDASGYEIGSYPEPVTVESEVVTAFICPALFTPTATEEKPEKWPAKGGFAVSPNPIAGRALMRWQLPSAGRASVRIYDNSGRLVRTLVDLNLRAGAATAVWDGTDDKGRPLANGVYCCELSTSAGNVSRMVVLLK
jgi:protocatechuate 3,4-dioxygenase beta subunit